MKQPYVRDRDSGLLIPARLTHPSLQQQILAGGGTSNDPYFASVVLLLHCDGANNAVSFPDSSSKGNTCTSSNSTKLRLSTTNAKFGASSLFGDGTLFSNLITSADWTFGTGNFTIEWWGLHGLGNSGSALWSSMTENTGSPRGFCINHGWAEGAFTIHAEWNNDVGLFSGGTSNGPGNWNFYTLSRISNVWHATYNGVVLTPSVILGTGVLASVNFDTNKGRLANFYATTTQTGPLNGYADEIRITKGVGRYPGAISVPTLPFPNV